MSDLDAARLALRCLDLTSLNESDTTASVDALCGKALGPSGLPAAVCVWPKFVAQARAALPSAVKVAAVANFPEGKCDLDGAMRDTAQILAADGDEVDLVLPWRTMLRGDVRDAAAVVEAVRRMVGAGTMKLIIESGEMPDAASIDLACRIGLDAGVDFLKTSTGKAPCGASELAARRMLSAIASFGDGIAGSRRSRLVGFKASGGIRTVKDAVSYATLTAESLGAAALGPHRLRFGASGLHDDIAAILGGNRPAPAAINGY